MVQNKLNQTGPKQTDPEEQEVQYNVYYVYLSRIKKRFKHGMTEKCLVFFVLFCFCRVTQQLTWPSTYAYPTQSVRQRRNLHFHLSSAKRSEKHFNSYFFNCSTVLFVFCFVLLKSISISFLSKGKQLCSTQVQVQDVFSMSPMPMMIMTRRTQMMISTCES